MRKMAKNLRFLALSVLLLALVLVSAGCSSGDSDTWHDVTSLSQMNGTWQGSYSQSMTMREYYEAFMGEWNATLQDTYGNMTVRMGIDLNVTIYSSSMLMTGTTRQTETYSGGNIRDLWPDMRMLFISWGGIVNDSNYSVTFTESFNEPIALGDFDGMQINQNGNKSRLHMSEMGFPGNDYFVLTRR